MQLQVLFSALMLATVLQLSSSTHQPYSAEYDEWHQYWADQGYQPYQPYQPHQPYYPQDDYYDYYPYTENYDQYSHYDPYYTAQQARNSRVQRQKGLEMRSMMQNPFLVDSTFMGIDLPGMGDIYESLVD